MRETAAEEFIRRIRADAVQESPNRINLNRMLLLQFSQSNLACLLDFCSTLSLAFAMQPHLIVNHIPLFAAAFGGLLALGGLLVRQPGIRTAGLLLCIVAGISGVPAHVTGEDAEHSIGEQLDPVSAQYMEAHEESAEALMFPTLALGILAAFAWFSQYKGKKVAPVLVGVSGIVALGLTGWMMWAAHLGGQIRHPEMRDNAAATAPQPNPSSGDDAPRQMDGD